MSAIFAFNIARFAGSLTALTNKPGEGRKASNRYVQENALKTQKNMAANFASRHELWSHRGKLSYYIAITNSFISIFSLT